MNCLLVYLVWVGIVATVGFLLWWRGGWRLLVCVVIAAIIIAAIGIASNCYRLLVWVAIGAIFLAAVGFVLRLPDFRWKKLIRNWMLGLGAFVVLFVPVCFALCHCLPKCHRLPDQDVELPQNSVAIALAFESEDADNKLPGPGNQKLAKWLEEHAEQFSCILTQEAIIWALEENKPKNGFIAAGKGSLAGHLKGVPVYRIHNHDPDAPVRTLETLSLALGRLAQKYPNNIVLVAHDKHFERAERDLRSMFPNNIVNPCIQNVPYRDNESCRKFAWAFRELLVAEPLEFVQRHLYPFHPKVTLPPITLPPAAGPRPASAGNSEGGVAPVDGQP